VGWTGDSNTGSCSWQSDVLKIFEPPLFSIYLQSDFNSSAAEQCPNFGWKVQLLLLFLFFGDHCGKIGGLCGQIYQG
jgi:hypothetical protein